MIKRAVKNKVFVPEHLYPLHNLSLKYLTSFQPQSKYLSQLIVCELHS